MILVLGLVIPLVFALVVAFAPPARARGVALAGTLVQAAWFVFAASQFPWQLGGSDHLQLVGHDGGPVSWFAPLGLEVNLAVDSVSMLLIGLTALLAPICVLCSWTAITERPRTFYSWLLALQTAMLGVFMARDLILFYVFFEFTLVPMYVLINLYGSTNRKAAATKFFLYTFTGSIITLAGLVYVAWQNKLSSGTWTFGFEDLRIAAQGLNATKQAWVFWALLAGFAVKVPLFPVHTWLPLAHTEAPTAGSVVLAGVLLKLGTYGIYKFALGFVPAAAIEFAPVLAVLSIIGILYAGLICWVQKDVKKLVAYSSVSHLGYCVLGLFALNAVGVSGSILYMINHGLSTGALFLLIGMMYERYHTRSLDEVGGLAKRMPVWATFMVFFTMASAGLPGLNGYVSELFCMLGAFQAGGVTWAKGSGPELLPGATWGQLGPWYAFAAGVGMIVTAMYLLYMLGRIVWGPLREPAGHGDHHGDAHGDGHGHDAHGGGLPTDLNAREIGTLLPLAALCLFLGVYPKPLLGILEQPAQQVATQMQSTAKNMPAASDPNPTLPGRPGGIVAPRNSGKSPDKAKSENAAPAAKPAGAGSTTGGSH